MSRLTSQMTFTIGGLRGPGGEVTADLAALEANVIARTAEATTQAQTSTEQAGIATEQRELTEAAYQATVALAASVALTPIIYGSMMLPRENGVLADASTSGQVQLTSSRTALTGAASTAAALWYNPSSIYFEVDPAREVMAARNIAPCAFGTGTVATANRTLYLKYYPVSYGTAGSRQLFELYMKGEGAVGSWLIRSIAVPASAKGPFIVLGWHDNTNGYLSVCDTSTETWYDGAGVAKPANWAGLPTITADIVVGGSGDYVFPKNNSAARQSSPNWIGSLRDLIFADVVMTKANALNIFKGADPATELGGAANLRLHVPLAENGLLSTATYGARTGITVTKQGTLLPGGTMRRQGAANYVTIDRMPPIFATMPKTDVAYAQLSGSNGGTATGNLQVRLVGESGTIYRDWVTVPSTVPSAGRWAADGVILPEADEWVDVQVRFTGAPAIVANTGMRHRVQPVVMAWSQSEGVYSLYIPTTARQLGTTTALNLSFKTNAGSVSFSGTNSFGDYVLLRSGQLPGYLGDAATNIANMVAGKRAGGAHIVCQSISGTSLIDVMDDAQSGRTWEDVLARCTWIANRGPSGEIPVWCHFIIGWEAYSSQPDPSLIMDREYRPFLTGRPTATVTAAMLNHWLRDGTFSDEAQVVILPCNRNTRGDIATTFDASNEADQRDAMRNYAQILGYKVGPEQITHKMEGENAAGGLPATDATHPENDDWEGAVEMSAGNAEAILLGLGIGSYPGPVFFDTILAGSDATKVIVRASRPAPTPGAGLANPNTGYSTASAGVADISIAVRLRTKKAGGNPGAGFEARRRPSGGAWGDWAKANITGGVISGDQIQLQTVWTLAAGDQVEVRYHPGRGGNYPAGTITQDDWRAGSIFFTGPAWIAGRPDLLGFAVAGSNQALALAL